MDQTELERKVASKRKRVKVLGQLPNSDHLNFSFSTLDDDFEVWFNESRKICPWTVARILSCSECCDDVVVEQNACFYQYKNYSYHATLEDALNWLEALD